MPNRESVGDPDYLLGNMKRSSPKVIRQILAVAYPSIGDLRNTIVCAGKHYLRHEVNGFARFFDQRVRLPRLRRGGGVARK